MSFLPDYSVLRRTNSPIPRLFEKFLGTACGVLLLALAAAAQQSLTVPAEMVQYPDRIVRNAKIVSMDDPQVNSSPGRTGEFEAGRRIE